MLKVSLEPSCILVKEWHEVMKLSCIKTLRKFLSLGNLDFSSWLLTFLTSWWSSLIFLNVLMNCDIWNLMLTKKSKFDFPVCNWPFCPCANFKPKLMYQCCKPDVLEYLVRKYLTNERENFGVQHLSFPLSFTGCCRKIQGSSSLPLKSSPHV